MNRTGILLAIIFGIIGWVTFGWQAGIGIPIGFSSGWYLMHSYSQDRRFYVRCSSCDWRYRTEEGIIDVWKKGYAHASGELLANQSIHVPQIEDTEELEVEE